MELRGIQEGPWTEGDGEAIKWGIGAPLWPGFTEGTLVQPWQHGGGGCELVWGMLSGEVPAGGPLGWGYARRRDIIGLEADPVSDREESHYRMGEAKARGREVRGLGGWAEQNGRWRGLKS